MRVFKVSAIFGMAEQAAEKRLIAASRRRPRAKAL
jgi:hypothetical protein